MLHCIYHFTGDMQVVDNYEKDILLATGEWFDHPTKAKEYADELNKMEFDEPKPKKSNAKKEGKSHEKRCDEQ